MQLEISFNDWPACHDVDVCSASEKQGAFSVSVIIMPAERGLLNSKTCGNEPPDSIDECN